MGRAGACRGLLEGHSGKTEDRFRRTVGRERCVMCWVPLSRDERFEVGDLEGVVLW